MISRIVLILGERIGLSSSQNIGVPVADDEQLNILVHSYKLLNGNTYVEEMRRAEIKERVYKSLPIKVRFPGFTLCPFLSSLSSCQPWRRINSLITIQRVPIPSLAMLRCVSTSASKAQWLSLKPLLEMSRVFVEVIHSSWHVCSRRRRI